MSDVPLHFLRKTCSPEKVLQIVEQRECEHLPEMITRYTHPDLWGDTEYVFVCECGMSWDHDPNEEIDLDEVDIDLELETKQF